LIHHCCSLCTPPRGQTRAPHRRRSTLQAPPNPRSDVRRQPTPLANRSSQSCTPQWSTGGYPHQTTDISKGTRIGTTPTEGRSHHFRHAHGYTQPPPPGNQQTCTRSNDPSQTVPPASTKQIRPNTPPSARHVPHSTTGAAHPLRSAHRQARPLPTRKTHHGASRRMLGCHRFKQHFTHTPGPKQFPSPPVKPTTAEHMPHKPRITHAHGQTSKTPKPYFPHGRTQTNLPPPLTSGSANLPTKRPLPPYKSTTTTHPPHLSQQTHLVKSRGMHASGSGAVTLLCVRFDSLTDRATKYTLVNNQLATVEVVMS
jgi:hypothetical protein